MSDTAKSPDSPPESSPENLGLVRTDLANERTLLAYGRTALMVSGTGVSLIEFFGDSAILPVLGWGFVAMGLAVGLVGFMRFSRLHKRLHR